MTGTSHTLLARLDNVGDVLLTGPAVRAVRASGHRVTFLTSPRSRAAAELLPGVDDVVTFRAPWIDADPEAVDADAMRDLVATVAQAQFDEAVIFTSFHQSPLPLALLLRMAGVPTVAAVSVDYPGSLLDVRHLVDDDIHEVERDLSLVATLGHRLPAGDDGRLRVSSTGPTGGPPPGYVVVHPGASVPARAIPADLVPEAIDALVGRGHRVVITGGPGEAHGVAADGNGIVDLTGKTDLRELAGVLAGAAAVVTGNTGPAHLAAAVGTPVVEVYAPTVPSSRWRPWHVPHVLLGDQAIGCRHCRARRCPFDGQPCTAGITAGHVVAAVEQLLPAARVVA